MYYANLDGTWYVSSGGYWGGSVKSNNWDVYSELSIGRLTVGTAQEVSNNIKKIIWYDLYADTSFLKKADFFGDNLGWYITSAAYMEAIRNGTDQYYKNTTGFVQWNVAHPEYALNISVRKYYDWGATVPDDWISIINNNSVALINHLGHGNPWHTLGGLFVSSL
jgi:hypothetical protein